MALDDETNGERDDNLRRHRRVGLWCKSSRPKGAIAPKARPPVMPESATRDASSLSRAEYYAVLRLSSSGS